MANITHFKNIIFWKFEFTTPQVEFATQENINRITPE